MKKIIFILSILCVSCTTKYPDNTCKEEAIESSSYLEVKPLTYKGHKYLWFRTQSGKGFGGISHDPECLKNDLK